ncbi:hypothetical protein GCM10009117_21950 [Gangjinia marincola]|uniref:Uncharacterized protein n=1 Tax=Gangjinia marincola TaxID=578463 RepID=A0ABN1MJB8_9FLAO
MILRGMQLFWQYYVCYSCVVIIGYFAADWLAIPRIEKLSMYGALIIGIPYLLIRTNSDKFKKDTQKN